MMATKEKEGFYQNLSRKELQSMCKIYGLPANKSHSDLAKSLVAFLEKNSKSTSSGERVGGINKDSLPASITQLQFGAQLNSMADTSKGSYGYILSAREREIQRNTQTVKSNEFGCCLESKTYDKEGRNGSMHNSRKMSHCQCNGNGLNYREVLKKGSGEKLTLQKDGLVENMPQIRDIDIGSCPVEAAFASPIESSRKVPSSSFEFYVRSEEGINLYVDLNSSPSDWTKRFQNEVHICENVQSNKCQRLHEDLGCGDGDKELERSFLCDISAGQIKEGHVHTRSSSSSKIKISDHMDLATFDQPEEGDRSLISSAILPCSMSINVSEQLKEDRSLKSFNPNSTAENQIISVAESCAKGGVMAVVHSDVIDPPHIKLVCDSVVNSISDGSLSPALEYENSNLAECQNSTLQNVCSLVDTAVVNPGCSVSGSVEMQSSEVASCLKDAPCSPFENGGFLGLVDANHNTETEKGDLANLSDLNPDAYENHLASSAEEWERSNTVNGRESSECSQFSNTFDKTCFSSDNLDIKEALHRKRKHMEGEHQSLYVRPDPKILRSMTRITRKDPPRRSTRLMSK
uniref:uncharacterized protein LOC107434871 isoform X1 n=1 Tax=Ziziphus jujuba TaxID=326968 RepID=A0A6P4AWN2_ZIZJJ